MRAASRTGAVVLVVALGVLAACNSITGVGSYSDVICTGTGLESCANLCSEFGGTSWVAETSTCLCGDGRPFCGDLKDPAALGACCGAEGSGYFCDTDDQGKQFCNLCHPCGPGCCRGEGQTCLNVTTGVCGVVVGTPRQSCAAGLSCPVPLADGSIQQADCCESIALPGGAFPMGRSLKGTDQCPARDSANGSCAINELPEISVTLAPYELDRFEVTVGRFRAFFEAWDGKGLPGGAAPNLSVPDSGWQTDWNTLLTKSKEQLEADLSCSTNPHGPTPMQATWTHARGANENLPINCITWYEAFAFCAWDGGRLPTEAEWELAAGNGAANDLYPWGEQSPTTALAVYDCASESAACRPPKLPAAVGSLPGGSNRAGHRDLAGNVYEWTRDSIAPYPTMPTTDYAYLTPGFYGFPVIRGGDFGAPADSLRAAARSSNAPDAPSPAVGVRCARNH